MFSLFYLLSSRYLRRRKLRTLLVVASIALGVATLVATRTLNQCLGKAAQEAVTPWSSVTDLIVLNGQVGVPGSLAERIRAAGIPGISEVQPVVTGRVIVPELNNRSVQLVGIDHGAADSEAANRWGIRIAWKGGTWSGLAGSLWSLAMQGDAPAVVGRGMATALGPRADFHIRAAGRERHLRVLGEVDVTGPAAALGNNLVLLPWADASALIFPGKRGHVNQINIRLAPEADRQEARRYVQTLVGQAGDVLTAEANDQAVRDVTAGLELGFALGGTGALVVGLFLVYNALSVSVAERRRDIGILRSLGATRRQVASLFVAEAGALGLVGALLGVPLGLGLAHLGLGPFGRLLSDLFIETETSKLDASSETLLLAIFAGIATSLFAALVPALQASVEEPADAVRRTPARPHVVYRLLQVGGIVCLLAAGAACVALRESLPRRSGTFGGIIFLLVALLAAMPLLAGWVGRLIQPFFRLCLGLEGRLAADNLTRSPGRTGLVIGALAATVALMVQTAGFIHSTEEAVFTWIDEQVDADLLITAGSSASSSGLALPMDESVGKKLRSLEEVNAVVPVRFHRLDFRDRIVILIAVDADAFASSEGKPALARNLHRFTRLREPGMAVISENFAALHKVAPGQRISLRGDRGPVVEVLGTVKDYTWNRGTVLVDRAWFRREFADTQVDVFDVFLNPGADSAAVRQKILDRWGQDEALFVLSRDELRGELSSVLNRVYGVAYAQQAVLGLVALLGVVGALLISVLQRQRELGLLRAVGATRAQVLRSVLAEAVLMGLVGAVLGVTVGVALEWYTLDIMLPDESGFTFPLRVPWRATLAVAGLSAGLAAVAGLGPALQAMRLRIAEAIAYE